MEPPVKTSEDVANILRLHREQIGALGVVRLGLFGSFSRDEQRAESDVDVLVVFEPGRKSFDTFMGLAFLLEDILQRRVELLTPEALSPHMASSILREVKYVSLAA